MDPWFSVALAVFLAACAAGLMSWHVRSWRAQRTSALDPKELDYRRRQFRRRMQTSALLALTAVALPVGVWVMSVRPGAGIIYWCGVLLLVAWVAILAVIDIWATKYFYGKLRDTYRIEQARLQTELRRIQAGRGNGKPPSAYPGKGPGVKGPGPENKQ